MAQPRPRPRAADAHPDRPGVVVFSPLPPMPTGIGDYTYELLTLLSARYACTVVAEDGVPDLRVPAGQDGTGVRLIRLAEYERSPQSWRDCVHLYMVGNNPDHVYLLPSLIRTPGVVVLHDPGLHHLLDCATAALGDADNYCAAIEAEYGAPGRLLAEQWRAHALRDQQMIYRMPMLRHLLGPARHVVVHSRHAALAALTQAPDTPVTIAPHPFAPPAALVGTAAASRAAMRARLGIGADEIVFVSLGFVSHIKRIDSALRALARIAGRLPPFRYVIAGELRAEELDVARMARTLGLSRQVLTTGYVAEADFFPMIGMADVVINLRYPVGGETSGTLIRAMGSGACVVVTDAGPFSELPDGAVIRLPWGPGFETALADTLLRLALFPAARAQIGAAAAAHVAAAHSPAATLDAYTVAIEAARGPPKPWRWRGARRFVPIQARTHTGPLWRQIGAMPEAEETCPALPVVASAEDTAALLAMGYVLAPLAADWHPDHYASRAHVLLFLGLDAAAPLLQQVGLASLLNRVLAFGGFMVVSITGAPPHGWGNRTQGAAQWRAAGFQVDMAVCAPPPGLRTLDGPQPPGIVWQLTKVSEFQSVVPDRESAA